MFSHGFRAAGGVQRMRGESESGDFSPPGLCSLRTGSSSPAASPQGWTLTDSVTGSAGSDPAAGGATVPSFTKRRKRRPLAESRTTAIGRNTRAGRVVGEVWVVLIVSCCVVLCCARVGWGGLGWVGERVVRELNREGRSICCLRSRRGGDAGGSSQHGADIRHTK